MTDEAVPIEATKQTMNCRTYTVANSPAITKGTLMFISGDNTASFAATCSGAQFAGIAICDKEAADGCTVLALDVGGVWDLTASGAIPIGHKVIMAGGNRVQDADVGVAAVTASGACVVGIAMEAASASEVIRVDLGRR